MLLSPPLTAGSCSPAPSLKRSFSNATDDAYTPPATPPPLKRRRCPSSVASPAYQHDIVKPGEFFFDPTGLTTPPEYTHVPYDPDFGRKVCKQYKKSLIAQRACDAVTTAARKQKYGAEAALAHSPGSTPDHIRRSYEDEQRRLDQAFAEIIANSESEAEPALDTRASFRSGELGSKLVQERGSDFMTANTTCRPASSLISRDGGTQVKQHLSFSSSAAHTQHHNGVLTRDSAASIDASCTSRARSAYRISSLRRQYRLQAQHRSSLLVGS